MSYSPHLSQGRPQLMTNSSSTSHLVTVAMETCLHQTFVLILSHTYALHVQPGILCHFTEYHT